MHESSSGLEKVCKGQTRAVGLEEGRERSGMTRVGPGDDLGSWTGVTEGQSEAGVKQEWTWARDRGVDRDWARVEIQGW